MCINVTVCCLIKLAKISLQGNYWNQFAIDGSIRAHCVGFMSSYSPDIPDRRKDKGRQ